MKKRFGTALNCIDGRAQILVISWVKESFGVDYVDMIIEPGMDKRTYKKKNTDHILMVCIKICTISLM